MDKKRLLIILDSLAKALQANSIGEVVEFGCFSGTTSLFISRLLIEEGRGRKFHVYDSFSGLPAKSIEDASVSGSDFKAGELKASKKTLLKNFKKANLNPPIIHKAWFNELKAKELPEQITFAFLDGDFYHSIIDSLELVWPRLVDGGIIVVDDYERPSLPGVSRAIEDYLKQVKVKIVQNGNLAIISHQ